MSTEANISKSKKEKKSSVLPMMMDFLQGSKRYFIALILIITVMSFMQMISPQIIRYTIDSVLGDKPFPDFLLPLVERLGGRSVLLESLWMVSLAVIIFAVASALLQFANRLFGGLSSEKLVARMRDRLFSHIIRLPNSWHSVHHTGDMIQRCTSDVDMVRRFLSEQLVQVVRIVCLLILSLIFMWGMSPRLTLIAIACIPPVIVYCFFFWRGVSRRFLQCDENEGILSAIAQENLTGVRVVRAFGREAYERERFEKQNIYYCNLWTRLMRLLSAFWASSDILSGVQVMLILVFGSIYCVHGEMTAGELVAFASYNGMLIWPVRMLGRMLSEMSKASVSIRRIAEIMDAPVETAPALPSSADMHGDIVFDHVTFAYDSIPVLSDICLTIPGGSTLGILGSTGSGKSTLVQLLTRLYDLGPDGGHITIGGTDISSIPREELRRSIGMVLQEPFLFSRTLGENIKLTRPEATLDDIRGVSSVACLDESVMGFADRYDTMVGERGVTLSGGQKQRTAIARMLMQRAPIMIFDDSLSAVDTVTDANIRAALKSTTGAATVILIAQRITTIMQADAIAVMDRGRIIEYGTHESLLAAGGVYARICKIQMAGAGEENT